ncbi:MAG: hypothetical protein M1823_003359 [Watsoniomyces obsoletus]|nr:MAG: hypothetical protein M1823_003359 [Watsoniomyces obsoletus]
MEAIAGQSGTISRGVSPPPTKRRCVSGSQSKLPGQDPGQTLQVWSWNVNGIAPLIQKPITAFFGKENRPKTPLRTFLHRHGWPDVVCLQEVKIKSTDLCTQRMVEAAVRKSSEENEEPNYIIRFCLPKDKYNARAFGGKMYGVACIIREDFWTHVERCREVSWDVEGRVLVLETNYKLAIMNIYAVNGTDNPYKDPSTGEIQGTRHDRKLRFHQELLDESLRLEEAGFDVLLVGDMNIARGILDGHPYLRTEPHQHVLNRADFNQKFFDAEDGLHAVDVFRHLHGNKRKFTYYPRNKEWGAGCDRVDLIIASPKLVDEPGLLLESDILDSPQERSSSDHVPLFISLDKRKLRQRVEG